MTADIKAINCTSCGATLDVLGGHRVKSLTCGYCGSVMDRHADFQLLQQHRNRPERPATPLSIGMQATLKGVSFTIIGMIEYVSHQSGPGWAESYRWISFQLYSPTHGYCWLTWNKGHYLFSYRTRQLPSPVVPDGLQPKHVVRLDGRVFQLFEHYTAEIDYVEGALTWIAKVGDKVHVAEAIDPPGMFSYEQSATEHEYSIGEYMDASEVHAAFGIDAPPAPDGIHPAQPFEPGRFWPALAKVGPIFAGLAVLGLIFVLIAGGGREIAQTFLQKPSTGASTVPFTVTDANQLIKLEFAAPVSNNWVFYDILVNAAESDEPVLSLGQEISFYQGRDSDGYWSEGSKRAEALFKVPAAGDYEIEIVASEAGGSIPPLDVRLYDRILIKRYLVALLIVSILAAAGLHFQRHWFEKKRWADVLEDDDDD